MTSDTERRTGAPADLEIARRRWRNMMIAAESMGEVPQAQRRHLETMRRELGIPFAEANLIVEAYRREGGGIQLFGDRGQRLEVFRDILTMLLADGRISEKEKKLILRLAERLEIAEDELEHHLGECRAALEEAENRARRRMSSRIYRRAAAGASDGGVDYDDADEEERRRRRLSLLESLTDAPVPAPAADDETARRYREVQAEDEDVSGRLVTAGVLAEPQTVSFRARQKEEYERHGRVVSFLTLMVRDEVLGADSVQVLRNIIREVRPLSGCTPVEVADDEGTLTVRWRRETLDRSFFCTVIALEGQADHHTVPILKQVFQNVTDQKGSAGRLLILDMSGAEYISSAAIGAIIEVRAQVLEVWGDLRFVGLTDAVREVMELLGVDSFITSCEDVTEALWSFADFAETADR
ncbi:MAG: STAS domain-containing protein [Planctomycetota bacterium]